MKLVVLALAAAAVCAAAPAIAADKAGAIAYGKDTATNDIAMWTENGKQKVARGADVKTAPKDAAFMQVTALKLGDSNIRRVVIRKGSVISSPGPASDVMIYILSGRVKVTVGDETGIIGPGDAMREMTGKPIRFEVLEEVTTVETNLPAK